VITNPNNALEKLQNDCAAQILAAPAFAGIKLANGAPFNVFTEDEGDIASDFEIMLAMCGLGIVVYSPTWKVLQPDMPGPLLSEVNLDVRIYEAVIFNRSSAGTGIRALDAAKIVMAQLHLFQPASVGSPIFSKGGDRERERVFLDERDTAGRLSLVRVCHFSTSQVVD
jgi:hypothetical protein